MKKSLFMFLSMLCLSLTLPAQKHFELPLWNHGEGVCADSDAADAKLLCFLPDRPNGQAIVICPGGGYHNLCSDYEGTNFASLFCSRGISGFVLLYRLPRQRSEVPLADAQQALRIVRRHAAEWHIDPAQVGIMGSSAGGHLAATTATHFTDDQTRPSFQILLYPVITMDLSYTHKHSRENLIGFHPTDEQVYKYSNEKMVTSMTPRAFVALSCTDKIVPVDNSLRYVSALAAQGVQCSLHMYPEGYHGFGAHNDFKDYDIWTKELFRWLDKEVK